MLVSETKFLKPNNNQKASQKAWENKPSTFTGTGDVMLQWVVFAPPANGMILYGLQITIIASVTDAASTEPLKGNFFWGGCISKCSSTV